MLHGAGLEQIEPFALRDAFGDVDENDIAQFLLGGPDGTIRANVAGADDGYFISQRLSPFKRWGRNLSISPGLF
jgi:hypothetical protein